MAEYFDTTVVVAAIFPGAAFYSDAAARLKSATEPCMVNHGLAECCRTLTGKMRLPPGAAMELIEKFVVPRIAEVGIDRADVMAALQSLADNGLSGPIVYDALHAQGARKAGCSKVHTYNREHFKLLAGDLNVV